MKLSFQRELYPHPYPMEQSTGSLWLKGDGVWEVKFATHGRGPQEILPDHRSNNPNLGLRSRIQGLDPDSRILKVTVWTHQSFLKWLPISPGLEGVGEVKYKHGHVCLSTD